MISRIKGTLETVSENRVEIRTGDLVYAVLVPAYVENSLRLKRGEELELYVLYYLESGPGGSTMTPRLIGFLSEDEKEFHGHLVKVPGLGARTALKAMVSPPSDIARAIETEDRMSLANLPGVGKRTAEKIIASLKGKVGKYAAGAGPMQAVSTMGEMEEEAVQVLLQLSYKRGEAEQAVSRVKRKSPGLESAEELVQAVLKEAGGGAVR